MIEGRRVICSACGKVVGAEMGTAGEWKPVRHMHREDDVAICPGYWRQTGHKDYDPTIGPLEEEHVPGFVERLKRTAENLTDLFDEYFPDPESGQGFSPEALQQLNDLLAASFEVDQRGRYVLKGLTEDTLGDYFGPAAMSDMTVDLSDFFPVEDEYAPLQERIRRLLNQASAENASNTPDYVLAEYLISCLAAFDKAVLARAVYYGDDSHLTPGDADIEGEEKDEGGV